MAVVSPALPGLDADSVVALRRAGLGVVLVAAPEELQDGDTERMRRLGIDHVVASTELDSLPDTLASAGDGVPDRGEPSWDDDVVDRPTSHGRVGRGLGADRRPGPHHGGRRHRRRAGRGGARHAARRRRRRTAARWPSTSACSTRSPGCWPPHGRERRRSSTRRRLSDLARQVRDRLRVLTGLPRPDRWPEVRPAAFDELLERSAELAAYTVLDAGFGLEGDPPDPFGRPRRSATS